LGDGVLLWSAFGDVECYCCIESHRWSAFAVCLHTHTHTLRSFKKKPQFQENPLEGTTNKYRPKKCREEITAAPPSGQKLQTTSQ
jgi:hypothetical protein